MQKIINRKIGISTKGVEAYIIKTTFEIKEKEVISRAPKLKAISESIVYKSLVSLFKILPSGILSKNSFRGANNKLEVIFL